MAAPAPGPETPSRQAAGLLVLRAAGARHAVPAALVTEIARPGPLTRVPHAPASLLGLAHRRGAVLPVVSLARLLGVAEPMAGPAARLLVIARSAGPLALLVEAVEGLQPSGTLAPLDLDALLARDFGAALHRQARSPGGNALPQLPAAAAMAAPAGVRPLLGCRVAGQDFALPLGDVLAVARRPAALAPLPGADAAMLGSVVLQGATRPLVSLRRLLGLGGDAAAGERVILLRIGAAAVALLVDAVSAVLRPGAAEIDPLPPVLARGLLGQGAEARVGAILRRPDGGLVSLLEPAQLFDAATLALLQGEAAAPAPRPAGSPAGQGVLVFRLAGADAAQPDLYALPLASVAAVLRRPARLSPLPRAPDFVAGLLSWRGAALPVIEQRQRFGAAPGPARAGGRVLVVEMAGIVAGFAVDGVVGLRQLALQPAPAGAPASFGGVLQEGAAPILLVDPAILLAEAERDLLAGLRRRGTAA